MRRITNLPNVQNVAAGSTATISCPVGMTYEKIVMEYSGTTFTRAQIKNMELLLNGKVVQSFTDANEMQAINSFYGRADTAGFVSWYFNRREFDSLDMDKICALGTADVQTMSMRFDVDAGAVAPVMKAYSVVDDRPQPLGLFVKIKRFAYNFAASGEVEISDIPRGPRIMAAHFKKADISKLKAEVNGVKVLDASKTLGEVLQKENGRTPQTAGYTHVDFCIDGDIYGALVTDQKLVSDLRWRPTLDTSGAVTVIVEYLDQFEGL